MKVAQLLEGRGLNVLLFTDYLSRITDGGFAREKVLAEFKKLATALISRDFEVLYDGTLKMRKEEEDYAGTGHRIYFPGAMDKPSLRSGLLQVNYTTFKNDGTGKTRYYQSKAHYSAREILEMGIDEFLDHIASIARPTK